MTPEQLADILACIESAAENQDRLAASVPEGLPGNMYSSGRAAGLRMAKSTILAITSIGAE